MRDGREQAEDDDDSAHHFFPNKNVIDEILCSKLGLVGALWRLLLSPDGAVEMLLQSLGLLDGKLTVLGNSSYALWVLIAVDSWNWMGLPVLIFLAGLRQIQPEVFEAARLDGAGAGRVLWSIALPQLIPSISSLTTLSFINTFILIIVICHIILSIIIVIIIIKTFSFVFSITKPSQVDLIIFIDEPIETFVVVPLPFFIFFKYDITTYHNPLFQRVK